MYAQPWPKARMGDFFTRLSENLGKQIDGDEYGERVARKFRLLTAMYNRQEDKKLINNALRLAQLPVDAGGLFELSTILAKDDTNIN